jgi:hypothetical protein
MVKDPTPMLVVSTGRSWQEKVLHGYAQTFWAGLTNRGPQSSSTRLGPPRSTASRIQAELRAQSKVSFFFFGHGLNPPAAGFLANDGNAAVDSSTVQLLTGRTVSGTCCHGDQVGGLASTNGFSMFGYAGGLWVPRRQPHVQDMERAALAGPMVIAGGQTVSHAKTTAATEYARVAQSLHGRNRPGDRPIAMFVSINASIVGSW